MPYCKYCGAWIEPTNRRCPSCACAAETAEPRDEAPAQPGPGIQVILASRIISLGNVGPRVEEPAKLVRLARILDRSAGQHARMAAYLTNQLAEVCAAHPTCVASA